MTTGQGHPYVRAIDAARQEAQLAKLRRQVGYLLERSPLYRDKLDDPDVGPGALESPAALARFPLPASVTLVPPQSAPRSGLKTALIRIDVTRRPA